MTDGYPRNWKFDEDGPIVSGRYVRMSGGYTRAYGEKPILVLALDSGEEVGVWIFHTALGSKVARELMRCTSGDFDPGEQVTIEQLGWSQPDGRTAAYMNYRVEFANAVQQSPRQLLAGFVSAFDDPTEWAPDPQPARAPSGPDDEEIPY